MKSTKKKRKTGVKTKTVKADFLTEIAKIDAKYTDIKTFLTAEPKVIISAIEKYKYDNLSDAGEDKDKIKTQMERRIKKALKKKGTDALTEAELTETLYKVATGEITLSSQALKADLTEYTTETPQPQQDDPQESQNKPWFRLDNWQPWVFIGVPVVILTIVIIFWKQISKLWRDSGNSEPEEKQKEEIEI